MDYISNTTQFHYENTAVALGKFEGLHKGHQLLIRELARSKREEGFKSVMFTFDLPPNTVIKGEQRNLLYTKEERVQKLKENSLDVLIEHPFTPEFSKMTPHEFIKQVLVEKLGVKKIVVGEDFHFGYKRMGDVSVLKKYAQEYGYEVVAFPKLMMDGEEISSSRIRACLQKGQMEEANRLLDVPFTLYGVVTHGKQLGRTIGIPTANQDIHDHKYLPPDGVYVSRVKVIGGIYYGISNLGINPTVDNTQHKKLETNIFDFNEDIYEENIEVELLTFVRPETKFSSIEVLKNQIEKDSSYGREYIKRMVL